MADDKTKTAPQDASRVNVHEDYEVRYWTKKWNISPQELKDAVSSVGVSVKAIEKKLGK